MEPIDLMLLTGEWLLYLLAFILCVRPLVKQDRRFAPLFKYRKQMGWAFGALTVAHVSIYLFAYIDNLSFILKIWNTWWFLTGSVATVLTLALTATSNKYAQRKLKARWKTLHKATYYIGFLGIIHGELASKQTNEMLYVLLIAYCLLLIYRYRKWYQILLFMVIILGTALGRVDVTRVPPVSETPEQSTPLAYERCGQYGLDYYEADNGFYNCRNPE